jgi:hypothetical protein
VVGAFGGVSVEHEGGKVAVASSVLKATRKETADMVTGRECQRSLVITQPKYEIGKGARRSEETWKQLHSLLVVGMENWVWGVDSNLLSLLFVCPIC